MRIPLLFGLGLNPTIPSPRPVGPRPPPRPVDPAGRVLPDPDARDTDLGSDLPRAGHPRQPRHRPPDQVGLVFDPRPIRCPRATPGRFRTRVITWVVADSLDAERAPVGGVADLPQRGQIRRLFPVPEIVCFFSFFTPSLHVDKHHYQVLRECPAHRDHHQITG